MKVPDRDGVKPRRCLLVANVFPPVHGGSASVYDSVARYGQGRMSVLAPCRDYLTGQELAGYRAFDEAAPFPVHRLPLLRTRMLAVLRPRDRVVLAIQDVMLRVRLVHAISRLARAEDIGTVCIGELVACGWLAGICRRLGLRVVIYVHGEEVSITDTYDPTRRRRRAMLAQADAVIAVSRFARDTLIDLMHVEPAKVALIPNGVDLSRFFPRAKRQDLVARYGLAERQVMLTVGRLSERKGMDKVIACLPALLARFPSLTYMMVGEGPLRPALEALAEALGVRGAVIFAGSVPADELADHYALADLFIMANRGLPSGETEGFGLVFLEANACAVPVVAGCAGGSVDAVTDEKNGLVVNGEDTAAITRAVTRMLEDTALRDRLVRHGLEVAAQSGWADRVERFLAVCDRVNVRT